MFISSTLHYDLDMPEHVIPVNDTLVSSVTLCVQETTRGKSTAFIDLLMLISSNYSVMIIHTGIQANTLTQSWNTMSRIHAGIFKLNKTYIFKICVCVCK